MARKVRIQYPGAIYHVMNRGDRREAIFEDDEDRQRLLETLTEACEKTGWQVHAYCLMRNHFHLVIETPQPNLVAGHEDSEAGRRAFAERMEWRRGGGFARWFKRVEAGMVSGRGGIPAGAAGAGGDAAWAEPFWGGGAGGGAGAGGAFGGGGFEADWVERSGP